MTNSPGHLWSDKWTSLNGPLSRQEDFDRFDVDKDGLLAFSEITRGVPVTKVLMPEFDLLCTGKRT